MGRVTHANLEPGGAKRRQILAGARQVFAELGFERASVDLIASRAGVSKATVYNHFEDKRALFVACVVEQAEAMREGLSACVRENAGDVEQVLQVVGERLMAVFLSPEVAGLCRQTMADAPRFPDLGRMIFERGPELLHAAIAEILARRDRDGELRIEDPRSAAVQFVALCQGDLVMRSRLGILPAPPPRAQLRDTVRRAVRAFLRAYRP